MAEHKLSHLTAWQRMDSIVQATTSRYAQNRVRETAAENGISEDVISRLVRMGHRYSLIVETIRTHPRDDTKLAGPFRC